MHAAAAGSIVAAMSDLDAFTAKLNAILQADLTHAGGCCCRCCCSVFRGRLRLAWVVEAGVALLINMATQKRGLLAAARRPAPPPARLAAC
jgi:hypothetical protein